MTSRESAPIGAVARLLADSYPEARTELDHASAFELLVATVLSAQTTDVRVNAVTADLFDRFPDAAALAAADEEEVTELVRPLGMGPTRARRILDLSAALVRDHAGEVPSGQQELEALAGVGRKTALVVRGVWFGQDALAVDTHVTRLAGRLGWTRSTTAVRVEKDVLARRDEAREVDAGADGAAERAGRGRGDDPLDATRLSLRLILHGRRVCLARSPHCTDCELASLCPSAPTDELPDGEAS